MIRWLRFLKVRREEWWVALPSLLMIIAFNALMVAKYYDRFAPVTKRTLSHYISYFTVSGYDPLFYNTLTYWHHVFKVFRHPLLTFMLYPFSVLNDWLTPLCGVNTAQFIVAALMTLFSFYAIILLLRILRNILHLPLTDAALLTFLFLSFGYTMVAMAVPDHFIISACLLLLIFYLAGRKQQDGSRFGIVETILLFIISAGVTLTNGVKLFLCTLFTNRRRFFHPAYLILAVIVPVVAMWAFCQWEDDYYIGAIERNKKAMRMRKAEQQRQTAFKAFKDTTHLKDSLAINEAFEQLMTERREKREQRRQQRAAVTHTGKPIAEGRFMGWTDVTTPRGATIIHNLMGESLQLHEDHVLEDTLKSRPVIIPYRHWYNYVAEGFLSLLFLGGIWAGRRNRFLWMVLSCFAFDMLLHLGLGFGINEIYINAPHWLMTFPIAIAFLLRAAKGSSRSLLRLTLGILVVWLLLWNVPLYVRFLLG